MIKRNQTLIIVHQIWSVLNITVLTGIISIDASGVTDTDSPHQLSGLFMKLQPERHFTDHPIKSTCIQTQQCLIKIKPMLSNSSICTLETLNQSRYSTRTTSGTLLSSVSPLTENENSRWDLDQNVRNDILQLLIDRIMP